jgi:hypothetical protein
MSFTVELLLDVEAADATEAERIGQALARFLVDHQGGWVFQPVTGAVCSDVRE